MNWSEYSRFVGDIFGAPLALEALIAFFMESTFVGLWIFGWNKLSKKVHLLMIYLTALGSTISAIFILAANSWMQNPVGAAIVKMPDGKFRAELTNFIDLITNPFFLATFPHVIGLSFLLAGGMVVCAAGWWLAKGRSMATRGLASDDETAIDAPDKQSLEEQSTWRMATRFGAWIMLIGSLVAIVTGDFQGKVEASHQPLKFAASEAVFNSCDKNCAFAIIAFPKTTDGKPDAWVLPVPSLLSILVNWSPNTSVQGLNDLTVSQVTTNPDGTGEYLLPPNGTTVNALQESLATASGFQVASIQAPNVWVTFYAFRVMILVGFLMLIFSIVVLVKTKGENTPKAGKGWTTLVVGAPLLVLVGSSCGWILTEIGRQPWIVYGVLPTSAAYSSGVTGVEVLASMILYTLIYAAVAVIVVQMFIKVIQHGLPDGSDMPGDQPVDTEDAALHFAY
jgi:cytochrome d ubiquinol oxidase subunit I